MIHKKKNPTPLSSRALRNKSLHLWLKITKTKESKRKINNLEKQSSQILRVWPTMFLSSVIQTKTTNVLQFLFLFSNSNVFGFTSLKVNIIGGLLINIIMSDESHVRKDTKKKKTKTVRPPPPPHQPPRCRCWRNPGCSGKAFLICDYVSTHNNGHIQREYKLSFLFFLFTLFHTNEFHFKFSSSYSFFTIFLQYLGLKIENIETLKLIAYIHVGLLTLTMVELKKNWIFKINLHVSVNRVSITLSGMKFVFLIKNRC